MPWCQKRVILKQRAQYVVFIVILYNVCNHDQINKFAPQENELGMSNVFVLGNLQGVNVRPCSPLSNSYFLRRAPSIVADDFSCNCVHSRFAGRTIHRGRAKEAVFSILLSDGIFTTGPWLVQTDHKYAPLSSYLSTSWLAYPKGLAHCHYILSFFQAPIRSIPRSNSLRRSRAFACEDDAGEALFRVILAGVVPGLYDCIRGSFAAHSTILGRNECSKLPEDKQAVR